MSRTSGDSTQVTRAVLTRDRIVAAAVAIVDERGPDALTMRAVADRLGAGAMSLYRHVAGREELLDLVLAEMAADIPLRPLTGEWRLDLAGVAQDIRAALLRRPHLTVLLTTRSGRGAAEVAMLDRTLGILRAGGFSRHDAVLANHALGNFVAGAALWEAVGMAGSSGSTRDARRRETAEAMAALPADVYPALAWVGEAIIEGSLDERFEYGLAALLEGLAAGSTSRTSALTPAGQ